MKGNGMRCREVQYKLDLFVTQELTSAELARIEAHLESCAACRKALAKLLRLEDLLVAAPVPPVPEGFAGRIVARARGQQSAAAQLKAAPGFEQSAWTRVRFTAGTAAALAAGLLLGLLMGYQTWRSGSPGPGGAASQSNDLLAASGFGSLVEPGGDSLAQSYLSLTMAGEH
jgi:hypothetical protein